MKMDVVREVNARSPIRKFDHTHLLRGFYSAQAPQFAPGTSVMLKNEDLVLQWALVKRMCSAPRLRG